MKIRVFCAVVFVKRGNGRAEEEDDSGEMEPAMGVKKSSTG
jgi:hypothetical protein